MTRDEVIGKIKARRAGIDDAEAGRLADAYLATKAPTASVTKTPEAPKPTKAVAALTPKGPTGPRKTDAEAVAVARRAQAIEAGNDNPTEASTFRKKVLGSALDYLDDDAPATPKMAPIRLGSYPPKAMDYHPDVAPKAPDVSAMRAALKAKRPDLAAQIDGLSDDAALRQYQKIAGS